MNYISFVPTSGVLRGGRGRGRGRGRVHKPVTDTECPTLGNDAIVSEPQLSQENHEIGTDDITGNEANKNVVDVVAVNDGHDVYNDVDESAENNNVEHEDEHGAETEYVEIDHSHPLFGLWEGSFNVTANPGPNLLSCKIPQFEC